jgi:hypothetical protein
MSKKSKTGARRSTKSKTKKKQSNRAAGTRRNGGGKAGGGDGKQADKGARRGGEKQKRGFWERWVTDHPRDAALVAGCVAVLGVGYLIWGLYFRAVGLLVIAAGCGWVAQRGFAKS